MSDAVEDLMVDFVSWLAPSPKPYEEVMEAWRTSCPRRAHRHIRLDQRPLLVRELVAFHKWRPPCRHGNLSDSRVFRQSLC